MNTAGAAQVEALFQRAVALHRQLRLAEARSLYEQVVRSEPRHFHALHLLGIVALQSNQAQVAIDLFGKAILIDPSSIAAHVNQGNALQERQRLEEAIACYDKAIALKPDCAEAFHNRGNALRELKTHAAAIASYDRAIALKPDYAQAHQNRGLALSDLDQREAAIASYDQAISHSPHYADPYFNRGNELRALGRHDAALASYDKAVLLQAGFADAHLNRGAVLVEMHRYADALSSFDKAIALRPDYAEAHLNRGAAFQHLGQYAAAVASYDAAIAIRPGHSESHADRGRALREMKRYEAAIASYDAGILVDPDFTALYAVRRHIKMQICDWVDWEADLNKITAGVQTGTRAPNPFFVLTLCDSAALQRSVAENWVREQCPPCASGTDIPKRRRNERIHIGYFSADFQDHATAYLIARLFELHDRSLFRVTAFSFGPDSSGAMRKRLKAGCDEFIDVRGRSDAEVAHLARSMRVDIAADMKGFTQDHRAGIFAHRAAPVQVNYLACPGTMGAPYMDYLVADRILVPVEYRPHYAEKIIYLPHSYQANDAKREIANKAFTRAELGLPEGSFVFCCFNNSYKILPPVFDRWMRILLRVPDSVLWLLADNPSAVGNLRREAAARGVAPRRLIFANRIDLPNHLARHRAADLFIDTLPCNAHTTASDALWAGLPVLTCVGEALAARVAASLLTAIGLPELIVSTLDRYEELAVSLATHPDQLAELRRRLGENRLTAPLFDTLLYARHIEAAFTEVHERFHADLPPDHIEIGRWRSTRMPMKLRVICATRESEQQFAANTALGRSLALFPYPFVELRLFASNSIGLPKLYNIALREAESDPAFLIFIHDDVQLLDFFWPDHVAQGLRVFDVIGLAGNMRRVPAQPAWRFKDDQLTRDDKVNLSGIVAHGSSWPPDYVSYYGPTHQQVKLLDGVMIACRSETLLERKLFFDEEFDFHFYDLDFCRQAELHGLRLGTWSISALHASDGQFGTPSWRTAYAKYLAKWKS